MLEWQHGFSVSGSLVETENGRGGGVFVGFRAVCWRWREKGRSSAGHVYPATDACEIREQDSDVGEEILSERDAK